MVQVTELLLALVIGAPGGVGILLVFSALAPTRRSVTGGRIAPYVSDVSTDAHTIALASGGASRHRIGRRVRLNRVSQSLANRSFGDTSLSVALRRAGRDEAPSEWTSRRLLWTLMGAVLGLVLGGLYAFSAVSLAPALGLFVLGGAAGWWMPLWLLRRETWARARDLEDEMTTGLEMLGLCLGAGEDLVGALNRISRIGSGPFTKVVRDAVDRIDVGVPVAQALDESASAAGVPALTRAIEHFTATLERGTPLVDVLTAQVSDSREEAKRRLLESAGKNEVLMLIPLVFLILPITIAFAVFPGLIAIQSGL